LSRPSARLTLVELVETIRRPPVELVETIRPPPVELVETISPAHGGRVASASERIETTVS